MKITYTSIYSNVTLLIFLMLLLKVNFDTLFLSVLLTGIVFFLYLIQKRKNVSIKKWIIIYILLEFLLYGYELLKLDNIELTTKYLFINYGEIFLLFLVFPISEVINKEKDIFFKKINYLGLSILVLRFFIWLSYNFFHINMGLFTFGGGRPDFTRSIGGLSLYRAAGTFIDGFLFAYALSNCWSDKKKKKYIFELLFLIFYAVYVYQSRTQIIFYVSTIVITIIYFSFISRGKKVSQGIRGITAVGSLSVLYLAFSSRIQKFFDSFSTNAVNGSSTLARQAEYEYFSMLWRDQNIWTGFGYYYDKGPYYNGSKVFLSDLGIIVQLYQFGIIGFILSLIPLIIGFVRSFTRCSQNSNFNNRILFILALYLLISSSSFNPYIFINFPILVLYISMLNFI